MDPLTVSVVLGAVAGGLVQGLSGTAFGLTAMAVWAWTLDPVLTGPLVVFGSLVGQVLSVRALRRGFSLPQILPLVAGGFLGVPVGVALLQQIDPLVFKLAVGILLAVWGPVMLLARDLPRVVRGGRLADAAVGLVGGVMGGLGGLSGPAPALWAALRGWDRDTQRAMIQGFNLAMQALTMITYIASGTVTGQAVRLFPAVAAAVLLPSFIGLKLYGRFSDATFRTVILGLLTASGLILIATTIPKLL
jgi:uncharacterized membrane protein YfcA